MHTDSLLTQVLPDPIAEWRVSCYHPLAQSVAKAAHSSSSTGAHAVPAAAVQQTEPQLSCCSGDRGSRSRSTAAITALSSHRNSSRRNSSSGRATTVAAIAACVVRRVHIKGCAASCVPQAAVMVYVYLRAGLMRERALCCIYASAHCQNDCILALNAGLSSLCACIFLISSVSSFYTPN